jgi:hypothetical protein
MPQSGTAYWPITKMTAARPASRLGKPAGHFGGHGMNGELHSHDAKKTLGCLRDRVAQNEKPTTLFFGAGTSCFVMVPSAEKGRKQALIPAAPERTATCKKDAGDVGQKCASAWAAIEVR